MVDFIQSFLIEIQNVGILAITAFLFSVYKYFDLKQQEQNDKEFDRYHQLIKDLVEPANHTATMYASRQVAIIYELRYFKRYYEVSERILSALRIYWQSKECTTN